MPMFYVSLFYNFPEGSEHPYRPEFVAEGENFADAAAKSRRLMQASHSGEVEDRVYVTAFGWPLPGNPSPKRLS